MLRAVRITRTVLDVGHGTEPVVLQFENKIIVVKRILNPCGIDGLDARQAQQQNCISRDVGARPKGHQRWTHACQPTATGACYRCDSGAFLS